jgi:AICAR transformylase/IMP cyclohydrolase PurH
VLSLSFKPGLKKTQKANAVDQYLLWNELSEEEHADLLRQLEKPPAPITEKERQEWVATFDGLCLSSDAYIPFRDNIDRAAKSHVSVIAHPGGSVSDEIVQAACNQYGIQLIETGIRCFLH